MNIIEAAHVIYVRMDQKVPIRTIRAVLSEFTKLIGESLLDGRVVWFSKIGRIVPFCYRYGKTDPQFTGVLRFVMQRSFKKLLNGEVNDYGEVWIRAKREGPKAQGVHPTKRSAMSLMSRRTQRSATYMQKVRLPTHREEDQRNALTSDRQKFIYDYLKDHGPSTMGELGDAYGDKTLFRGSNMAHSLRVMTDRDVLHRFIIDGWTNFVIAGSPFDRETRRKVRRKSGKKKER